MKLFTPGLLAAFAVMLQTGCESPSKSVNIFEETTAYKGLEITEPEFIVVHRFSVTHDQIKLMEGLSPAVIREFEGQTQTQEQVVVGEAVSTTLKEALVKELNNRGIPAYAANDTPKDLSFSTGHLHGLIYEIDQGNRTERSLFGFGIGDSNVSAHVIVEQGETIIADMDMSTETQVKIGNLPIVSAVDEALLGAVEDDAKRMAIRIADEFEQAYKRRGWL